MTSLASSGCSSPILVALIVVLIAVAVAVVVVVVVVVVVAVAVAVVVTQTGLSYSTKNARSGGIRRKRDFHVIRLTTGEGCGFARFIYSSAVAPHDSENMTP